MRPLEPIIEAENLSKKFCRGLKQVMIYGACDVARDFFGIRTDTAHLRSGEFWALREAGFHVERGEVLGIIGPNGSGKSTLLKMLNGIYPPDEGQITIRGRVGALIEIGAGFHPMLTGRENVYVNGAILGLTKKQVDERFDRIVEFSEIGDFIDSPVRHYSTGMYVRLGFAIAVHCDPEILLVDEVLAVGDARFFNKCTNRIRELTERGTTIVLVSHNLWLIQTLCDRVVLLNRGRIVKTGAPVDCAFAYAELEPAAAEHTGLPAEQAPIVVRHMDIRDQSGNPASVVEPDAPLHVRVGYLCRERTVRGHVFLRVTTSDGYPLYTSYSSAMEFPPGEGAVKALVPAFSLLRGEYRLWAGICGEKKEAERYHERQMKLTVNPGERFPDSRYGVFYNRVEWQVEGRRVSRINARPNMAAG
ncbi:MAG TPA: ABC transporter ATP-binding protein [Syntrophales bacterium]|nr:ABC transporter ATP-binding protein [Syntrophales bacterium]